MVFHVFIWGIERSATVSPRVVDAIFHLWKHVGHLMGIDSEHLPTNEKEGGELLQLVTLLTPPADADSRARQR
ncbi:MAG: oxygenase MpaB family protein [Polyangiales bacterium]